MKPTCRTMLLGLLLSCPALACQYNVRDIGFVDLEQSTYRLYVFLAEDTADLRRELQLPLAETLDSTNVTAQLVSPGSRIEGIATPEQLPAAVLVSPRGPSLVLPLEAAGQGVSQSLADFTQRLVHSSFRTDLLSQAATRFAVVLLVESDDSQKNRLATLTVETSFMHITQEMAFMPKRIQSPPVMVKLTRREAAQHSLFLWELGVAPGSDPAVAILYGRLRTMGPVLTAEDISEENLNAYLGVIGADCECELDRRLLHTPMLAHHWPRAMYEAATEALAFDPENPEVKMEVSQIIAAHGPARAGELQRPDVTFGYQEIVLEETPVPDHADNAIQAEPHDPNDVSRAAVVDNGPTEKRIVPVAITPSDRRPLYGLVAVAAAVIVTGIIIVRRKK